MTPYESAATGKKISQLLAGKEGPRNAAHLDSFMQGKMNPLASEIIKACLPNGLAVPFPANVSTFRLTFLLLLFSTMFIKSMQFFETLNADLWAYGHDWC